MVKIATLLSEQRQVMGPQTHTLYVFQPYAMVEDPDAEAILALRAKQGCECNGSPVTYKQAFAKEEDILNGKYKPTWAGRYGSPA